MALMRRLALACVAGAVLAGCSGSHAADPASSPASSATAGLSSVDVAFVVQCADIVHAYDLWTQQIAWKFRWIEGMRGSEESGDTTKAALRDIKDSTDALSQAVTGRSDALSKQLAVAVADFEVKRAMVALETALGGQYRPETYQAMRDAAVPVNTALANFKVTCPPLQ